MSTEDLSLTPDVQSLLFAGEEIAQVSNRTEVFEQLKPGEVAISLEQDGEGGKRVVVAADLMRELDARALAPRDRRGTHVLLELDSLIQYVNRYKSAESIAWADPAAFAVVVVFNDHPPGVHDDELKSAAWRNHRATYSCPRSPEWIAWTQLDGSPMKQEAFADFIESRLEDLRAADGFPKPLDVLTMARNLSIRTKGTFERAINPTTGDSILVNKTETDPAHSTQIPRAFSLGIPVFEGGAVYQIEARVRFAVSEGRAAFSYTLHRRKEIERDAFADVRGKIAESTSVLLLAGKP